MEMFNYHLELINKMGFMEWIKAYPLNPFTIFGTIILLGLVIIIVVRTIRRRKSEIRKPKGAATLVLSKRNSFNKDLADEIKVFEINDEKAHWFFYSSGIAVYLEPGENKLKVCAKWASLSGNSVKTTQTNEQELIITAEADKIYSINYDKQAMRYILSEGDGAEDDKWRTSLIEENFIS